MYTFFDIETTGLYKYQDNILEVGYIRTDARLNVLASGNIYFWKEGFVNGAKAQEINHLTPAFMRQFEEKYDESLARLYTLCEGAILVGKNSDEFDIPFVYDFLKRELPAKVPNIRPMGSIDVQKLFAPHFKSMTGTSRKGQLHEYVSLLGISQQQVSDFYNTLNVQQGREMKHAGLYDTAMTYLVFKEMKERGYI